MGYQAFGIGWDPERQEDGPNHNERQKDGPNDLFRAFQVYQSQLVLLLVLLILP